MRDPEAGKRHKPGDTPRAEVPPDPDWPTFVGANEVRLFRDQRGLVRCTLRDDVSFPRVNLYNAFPVSEGKRYLAVTDAGGRHVAVIRDADRLDHESRQIADAELWRRYVVPKIRDIFAVRERFGVCEWHVETDRGHIKFTVRNVRENVKELMPGRFIVTDTEGNRYEIQDASRLPRRALRLVEDALR